MRARHDRLLLICALFLTLAGAYGHFTLPLDVRNAAMKSRRGADAAAQARRDAEFGDDDAVIAMLEPRGAAVSGAPSDPEVARWLDALRARPELTRVQVLPLSGPAATFVALRVRGELELDGALAPVRELAPPTHRLALTGQPLGEHAIAHALAAEQARVVLVILAALTVLLLAVYRRASLVAAALLPGVGAILWLGGIERLLGLELDPVSSLLAPVVLTVGVAGAVHVLEAWLGEVAQGVEPRAAAGAALRHIARPLAITSATSAAGFLALTPSAIPAVQRFGVLAALGVALATFWIAAIVPSWLRLFGARAVGATPRARRTGVPARFIAHLARVAPALVALAAAGMLLLGWRGLSVTTDTQPERVLPPAHPFRVESARVAARLGGDDVLELFLPAPHPPLAPLATARLVAELAAEPLVVTPTGPPRRSEVGSLLIGALLRPSGTAERRALFARSEAAAVAAGFPAARATGPAVQVARDSEELVRSQRRGFVAMLAVLWGLMALGLRSKRLALLGLVPNVAPCVALYGGLALAGRPLSVATAMIATVLLGLIVDNTIHLLYGYSAARSRGERPQAALASALGRAGRAVLTTGGVLALGFAAGLAGELETTIEFAVLAAATILLALACDLLLLPAILLLGARRAGAAALSGNEATCAETTT